MGEGTKARRLGGTKGWALRGSGLEWGREGGDRYHLAV